MGVLANKGRKAKASSVGERAAWGLGRQHTDLPRGRWHRVLWSPFPPLARLVPRHQQSQFEGPRWAPRLAPPPSLAVASALVPVLLL